MEHWNSETLEQWKSIKVEKVDEQASAISVRYSWFSKNPFKSIYFACLAMAAEMASGVLALVHTTDKHPTNNGHI